MLDSLDQGGILSRFKPHGDRRVKLLEEFQSLLWTSQNYPLDSEYGHKWVIPSLELLYSECFALSLFKTVFYVIISD